MEIGHRIGVTFQQVQKYEKGVNRIGSSRLMQICDVLQVTPAWLFEGAPGPQSKPTAAACQLDAAFTAFQADDVAPQLMPVWGRLPVQIKRLMGRADERDRGRRDRAQVIRSLPRPAVSRFEIQNGGEAVC